MLRFGKGGGWQGALDENRPDRPVFPYQRAFQCVATAMSDVDTFLSIGVGTGTALKSVLNRHPNVSAYGVEIDEMVLNAAMSFFDAPNHQTVHYWVGDGFAFVRVHPDIDFNLIFVDAYMRNSIYQPSATVPTLELLASRLRPGGVIVYNLILPSLQSLSGNNAAFVAAAKRTFASVIDLPVGFPYSEQNRLFILTDDRGFIQRLRAAVRSSRYLSVLEYLTWGTRLKQV